MNLKLVFLFSLTVVILSISVAFIACDEEEDDDDSDYSTSDDDDAADDDSSGTEEDCFSDWTKDMLDCADQVASVTRKEGAECVITSVEDLVACLESVGACDTDCSCVKTCNPDARDCIDPCGNDDDTCLDACDSAYNDCLLGCGWEDMF